MGWRWGKGEKWHFLGNICSANGPTSIDHIHSLRANILTIREIISSIGRVAYTLKLHHNYSLLHYP